MDNSRPSSPDAPPQDLWSSILDSVSTTRSIPSKQIILLGEPSSGKSSLASALLQRPPPDETKEETRIDFAIGYDWADVRDDADEDTLARLSVYTVPSSAPSFTALLPHFVPPRTSLPHTLVVIALDWTRPWSFIEELETWLDWVEKWVKGDGSRELDIAKEENRERLQAHWQHYTEPSSEPLPATATVSGTVLPLGQGTLTHNSAGVPIVVVCTKADLIDEGNDIIGSGPSGMGGMVKGKGGEWEERTDSIMQILRTICLKYGAGLFYTTPQPTTLQVLRQYALHTLFMPPAPSPSMGGEVVAPPRNPFPFQTKPNALDRDRIVIPAGWDSWGKIAVLREGFDARLWGEAWENDLEGADDDDGPKATKLYASLVPDLSRKPPPLPPLNNPTPEQVFLAKNYDENAKNPNRDPRGAFRNPNETASAGIVGPMGSSSFTLPNVERALTEMESSAAAGTSPLNVSVGNDPARKLASRTGARPPPSTLSVPTAGAAILGRSTSSTSPAPLSATTPNSADDQTQHQALKKFFDDLINKRNKVDDKAATAKSPDGDGGADGGS
ncbi:dynein light intermediate chain [Dichomitus squalens]|uniref:Dynein light intermediate chain n=1 Tax=Dichomitus squalens TaxID=114155 RepID=A0A4Q9NZ98_9APHY|nr:dynein light intermediate chain [Dichomitus squalens]TBU47250.1 dynein light intermediate chain [Dichomitus squalens]TBU63182.1 dynein light intermediate chain [Dichomitus squalens]